MTLKKYNQFINESSDAENGNIDADKVKRIYDEIVSKNSEEGVAMRFDDEILNWVDYDQMEEEGYESEYDYYMNYGNKEAEDAIIDGLISDYTSEINTDELIFLRDNLMQKYFLV